MHGLEGIKKMNDDAATREIKKRAQEDIRRQSPGGYAAHVDNDLAALAAKTRAAKIAADSVDPFFPDDIRQRLDEVESTTPDVIRDDIFAAVQLDPTLAAAMLLIYILECTDEDEGHGSILANDMMQVIMTKNRAAAGEILITMALLIA